MKKWIKRAVLAALLLVFVGSTGFIGFTMWQYRVNEKLYRDIAEQYTALSPAADSGAGSSGSADGQASGPAEMAPLTVDFEALREANPDVVGWIYCEGTVIDYPVLQGEDNDYYLHHTMDGKYSAAGSIFADAENGKGFQDANTVLYGHHMKNKSMFATLDSWQEQQYYEAHPVMWLLTPEQDYKIVLFSGYTTSAYSDTYQLITGQGPELDAYLQMAQEKSEFKPDVTLEEGERYVLLSTCAYVFDNARSVLHGKLVPVGSAGGRAKQ